MLLTRTIAGGVVVTALLYLAFVHLDRFPHLFFDEGSYLQVGKNLARHGLYAESSSEGPRYYGGPIGIGPTVHLPVALSLRLFGIGVWQARLVPALYLLLCIAAFHALGRELGSPRLAWTATVLLVVAPAVSLVPLGRRVMGEIPGLFYLLCALLLWFRRWQNHSYASLVAVGLLFGLAAVSKQQFTLMIDLTLAACAALNAVHYRLVRHRDFIVPLLVTVACHLGWSALFLALIPAEARPGIFANGRAVAAVATLILPPLRKAPEAMRELLRLGAYFGLLFPALAYAVYRGRERTPEEQRWAVPAVLALVNFCWYVLLTVGWDRYAFLGLSMASLLVARLIGAATDDFHLRLPARGSATRNGWLLFGARLALLAWVSLGVIASGARLAAAIAVPPPADAREVAEFIDANIPADEVIETWEPEIAFLSDHPFHFPPSRLMADAIAYVYLGGPPAYESYPIEEPRFLLAGEYSIITRAYDYDRIRPHYRWLKEAGAFRLYEKVTPP